jgi:hypothetical protein
MAEYAHNNSLTTFIQMSPFFAILGFHPQMNWTIGVEANSSESRNNVHWIPSVHAPWYKGLEQVQETMETYDNRHAKKHPKYSVCDLVMLNGKFSKRDGHLGNLLYSFMDPLRSQRYYRPSLSSLRYKVDGIFTIHFIYHSSHLIGSPPTLLDLHLSLLQPASRMNLVTIWIIMSTKQAMKLKKS